MKFTIGYIEHNSNVFEKFLKPSLNGLEGDFEIIKTSDKNCPAENYNEILKKSKTQYVILTHQDISFSKDLLKKIEKTINENKNFGILGLVGVDDQNKYRWSNENESFKCQTLDCCFVVINKENNLYFDSKTFNNFHLYVEDFCLQTTKKTNKPPYTILISSNSKNESFLIHHSETMRKLGPRWGEYDLYRKKLIDKWGRVKTT